MVVVALLLSISCSPDATGEARYELGEFFISGPNTLSAQASTLTAENTGDFPHTLVVTRPGGGVVMATDVVLPGQTVTLDLELGAGAYQFTCRIVAEDSDGVLIDHFERGMHTTVSVGG
jgi:hypothetical protein